MQTHLKVRELGLRGIEGRAKHLLLKYQDPRTPPSIKRELGEMLEVVLASPYIAFCARYRRRRGSWIEDQESGKLTWLPAKKSRRRS